MTDLALDRYDPRTTALSRDVVTPEQIDLLKNTICKGATNDELALFIQVCNRTGLDPFARQIHAVKRWDAQAGRETMSIQTGIDGYRLIAERTSRYDGQRGPFWCDDSGEWRDVWLADAPPSAAKVDVYKTGMREPISGVATWREYAQTKKGGELVAMWRRMPAHMLGKCAEALALRKAFPQELSGIYTTDEMATVAYEDAPTGSAVTMPAEPVANSTIPTVPTVEQIRRVRSPEAADKLIKQAGPDFGEFVSHAVLTLHDTLSTRDQARDWWVLAGVKDRRDVLEYAVELHDQHQYETHEMSGEGSAADGEAASEPSPDSPTQDTLDQARRGEP